MKIISCAAILTAAAMPCTAVYAADNTKKGYGQGTAVDEKNRPLGAVEFNSRYGGLDAFALSGDSSRIIITFDQGYENGYTSKILDTLKEKDVQAIFFLTGSYARTEHELVKRMIDEGHIIGNHGMTHASLPTRSEENEKEEIMSLHSYVRCSISAVPAANTPKEPLRPQRTAATGRSSGAVPMWTGKQMLSRCPPMD